MSDSLPIILNFSFTVLLNLSMSEIPFLLVVTSGRALLRGCADARSEVGQDQ